MAVKKRALGFFVISLAALAIWQLAARSSLIEQFELRSWDLRARRVAGGVVADPRISIVVIDQPSLDYFAEHEHISWPFPRELYVPVVQFLKRAGVAAIGFDLLFTEPSSYGVADDTAFAEGLFGNTPVVLAAAVRSRQGRDAVQQPIADLQLPNVRFGNTSGVPDSDGVYRRVSLSSEVAGASLDSLAFALYRASGGSASAHSFGVSPVMRMRGAARSYRTVPFAAVLRSQQQLERGEVPLIDPAQFRDGVVLIGGDAPGLLDLRPTSVGELFPGVELNATVLDNLLHADFVNRLAHSAVLPWQGALLAVVVGAVLFGASFLVSCALSCAVLAVLMVGGALAAVHGVWVPIVAPIVAMVAAFVAALAYRYYTEGRELRFIRSAFKQYVSAEVIDEILEDPERLVLGGAKRELTVFSLDIAGFTALSEALDPAKVGAVLNDYFTVMTRVVLKHGGTLDKYIGDGLLAFWNAPLPVREHALHAVQAALECLEVEREFAAKIQAEFGIKLRGRIGIHTGEAVVGNFGSHSRFSYTAIGSTVNLGCRLEGVNKVFGGAIVISESTWRALAGRVPARRIGAVRVVGASGALMVYEPARGEGDLWQQFAEALGAFESGAYDTARHRFAALASSDPPARAYLSRLEQIAQSGGAGTESAAERAVWQLASK